MSQSFGFSFHDIECCYEHFHNDTYDQEDDCRVRQRNFYLDSHWSEWGELRHVSAVLVGLLPIHSEDIYHYWTIKRCHAFDSKW